MREVVPDVNHLTCEACSGELVPLGIMKINFSRIFWWACSMCNFYWYGNSWQNGIREWVRKG